MCIRDSGDRVAEPPQGVARALHTQLAEVATNGGLRHVASEAQEGLHQLPLSADPGAPDHISREILALSLVHPQMPLSKNESRAF